MDELNREEENNECRLYWTIALIVALAIMAFVISLYKPYLCKECSAFYQQALNRVL